MGESLKSFDIFFFFRSRVIVSDTISVSPFRNGLRRKGRKVAF